MDQIAFEATSNPDVLRLVAAVERDVDTARIFARPGGLHGWRYGDSPPIDEDDGFGPFDRPPKVPRLDTLPAPHSKPIEPFALLDPVLPPFVPSVQPWPLPPIPVTGPPRHADDTFLVSVFESIAGHRAAQTFFQEPVTDEVAPGYSQAVKKPKCLSDIRSQLREGSITTIEMLYQQLSLMLCNAFMFNARNTEVYLAAMQLQEVVQRECEPLMVVSLLERLE